MLLTSQVGSECFCGDYLTKSHKKSDSECKMACKGKRDQACGDHWRVLIYRNPYYRCKLLFLLKLSLELSIIHFFSGERGRVPFNYDKKYQFHIFILVFTAILVTSGKCFRSIPFMKENNIY